MRRYLGKVGRFFWSWGILTFLLWAVTILILIRVEEDWRGARMWTQTKAKWEAKGETFDYSRFIPPPIPDSQNLGAIRLFKLEPDPELNGRPGPVALQKALHPFEDLPDLSYRSSWLKGEPPDLTALKQNIAEFYQKAFHAPAMSDSVTQLEAIYPFIPDLNAAAAKRPYCRFDFDYTSQPPSVRPMMSITSQMGVAKLLSIHGDLALAEKRSDLAFADVETELKLNYGTQQQPLLVAGLVAVAETMVTERVIGDGLRLHAWTDAQLAQFESDLGHFDFLALIQFDMRGELTGFSLPSLDYIINQRPSDFIKLLGVVHDESEQSTFTVGDVILDSLPKGWMVQNKCSFADALLRTVALVQPEKHRTLVDEAESSYQRATEASHGWLAVLPWRILTGISVPPILHATLAYTRGQVWLDEARIACALERYRLAHRVYPTALDDLAPSCIDVVPHDVINGEAYRYRVRPDGTFLLYSVGWNQKDDGGLVVTKVPNPDDPNDSKDKHGDWVWPTPK